MDKLNEFFKILLENSDHKDIEISKKIKYGYKYYYISMDITINKDDSEKEYNDRVSICVDNRNECVELNFDFSREPSIIIN